MGPLYVLPIKGPPQRGPLFAEECSNKGPSKNVLPIRTLCKGPPKGISNGALCKGPLMSDLNADTNKRSTAGVNVLQKFGEHMLRNFFRGPL